MILISVKLSGYGSDTADEKPRPLKVVLLLENVKVDVLKKAKT